jgi:hypothetical protein
MVARRIGMLLITIFVELRVVAGEAESGQVAHRPSSALALRRTAWARHGKCETDTAALCKSNRKDIF